MFITFEGPEGAGKTTQVKLLTEYFHHLGKEVLLTREPGGTTIGREIRVLLLDPKHQDMSFQTELLLYAADRSQHVEEVIKPALLADKTVISDRYFHSTIAYQCYGRGLDRQLIERLNEIAIAGIYPDLTILLDLPPETGLLRVSRRMGKDRIEKEDLAFHERVRQGFLTQARSCPEKMKVISAAQNPEQIFAEIKMLVTAYNKGEERCE